MVDLTLTPVENGTLVTPRNALGQRVIKARLTDCGDFNVLGIPVLVKMPTNIVRSLLKNRGARLATTK
jgi:hypothetical protein